MSRVSLSQLASQEARLAHQRRTSTFISMVIAVLFIALIMLILGFIFLPSFEKEQNVLVTYQAPSDDEPEVTQKKLSQSRAKPSAPSAVTSKVIAANTRAPVSIPVPEVEVTEPSLEFGIGDDFGEGGWDSGEGGGGATFFNQTVSARRICYVIDYSASMRGKRDKLMREELTKSIKDLSAGMQFQMLFFAGPVWVAGNEVSLQARKTGVVKDGKTAYDWKTTGGAHGWEPVGKRQQPEWLPFDSNNLDNALRHIKETDLVWGTIWDHPLEMALSMDPKPEIVFFMTDGSAGGNSVNTAKEIVALARRKGVMINTVALMQPRAEEGLKTLAEGTAGQFTIVREDGKVEVVEAD
jgi:hypothetical protein